MPIGGNQSERVLVFAPLGRDSELLAQAARSHGMSAISCASTDEFCRHFAAGCGAALLTEEALYVRDASRLGPAVSKQPTWSDVPFVILTSRGQADERVRLTVELMNPLRNVTVLERPVRPQTIIMALDAALRDRRRQYEVRDAFAILESANRDLEVRVEERTAELVSKVVELEGFCYSVSHDMRAPLRAIVANARMFLEERGESVDQVGRAQLERLSAAALKMARLVDDLLLYARLAGSSLKAERFDFSALAARVAEEVLLEYGEGSKGEVNITPGLYAEGDARFVGLAMQNLIDNALKYSSRQDHPVVEVGKSDGAFFVKDNGIGFDMQFASKIFKPFERLHRDAEFPGTGIGLANVQRIIERHGGQVWAEGVVGQGATFFFTLGTPA